MQGFGVLIPISNALGHIILPCQVKNKRGMLQWTRDGFGLGVERNLTGFDRYHMSGYDEEGKKLTHTVILLKLRFCRICREILCNFVNRKILAILKENTLRNEGIYHFIPL